MAASLDAALAAAAAATLQARGAALRLTGAVLRLAGTSDPSQWPDETRQLQALALVALLALLATATLCRRYRKKPTRGYGSGENGHWNRHINYNRPQFRSRHYKLTDVWTYAGAATSANLEFVRTNPLCTLSAEDPSTKCPLSGHLIGRQTWQKVERPTAAQKSAQDSLSFDPSANVNAGDKLLRAQLLGANGGNPTDAEPPSPRGPKLGKLVSPEEALDVGWDFYSKLQCEDGHWAGDYGGPLFLLPGMVIVCFVSGFDLAFRKPAMVTYMSNHQQEDGGWGLHIEGPSTLFCTTLNYCAMRLLGVGKEDPRMVAARAFIHANGGAPWNCQWGKYWLALLGAMDWEGVTPIPPELWLLPYWFPFHPGKMWCHSRLPYLGMSYVYGTQRSLPFDHPMAKAFRQELYCPDKPYEGTNWEGIRNQCAVIDLYAPHTWVLDTLMWGLRNIWEKRAPRFLFNWVRARGVAFAAAYVDAEDLHTNYICIGPVNKVNNMMTVFFNHGPDSEQFKRHCARLDDYLWVAEDGMKMQGYNGSQLWDTAFAAQALGAAGPAVVKKYAGVMTKIAAYVDASQIKEDVPMREQYFRTISKGGWPFSTNDHGWPIADCTSEGLKAALLVRSLSAAGVLDLGQGYNDGMGRLRGGHIHPDRLADAVNVILAFHNPDGGWATYEEMRGGDWYEWLNPAEVWGDLMIDYTYTELTSSCIQALAAFHAAFPHVRTREVKAALAAAIAYVRAQQREDGSWYGSWAVCFTYGCWFGVEALTAAGEPEGQDKEALIKVCAFLLSKQRADGGWGESYVSCLVKEYSDVESTSVNTAWALLALIHAQCSDGAAVERGIRWLIAHQTSSGDWAQEWCSGIFNRTCGITYTAYRNVFPLWALASYTNGRYKHRVAAPSLAAQPTMATNNTKALLKGLLGGGAKAKVGGDIGRASVGSSGAASMPAAPQAASTPGSAVRRRAGSGAGAAASGKKSGGRGRSVGGGSTGAGRRSPSRGRA